MLIQYRVNAPLSCSQYVQFIRTTSLGARRPLADEKSIQAMLDNADLLVSAWCDDALVGIARSVSDFHFCCFLSDLAVLEKMRGLGIGKGLIRTTFSVLKPGCKMILLAAPKAVEYYPKIGFTRHDSAWVLSHADELG